MQWVVGCSLSSLPFGRTRRRSLQRRASRRAPRSASTAGTRTLHTRETCARAATSRRQCQRQILRSVRQPPRRKRCGGRDCHRLLLVRVGSTSLRGMAGKAQVAAVLRLANAAFHSQLGPERRRCDAAPPVHQGDGGRAQGAACEGRRGRPRTHAAQGHAPGGARGAEEFSRDARRRGRARGRGRAALKGLCVRRVHVAPARAHVPAGAQQQPGLRAPRRRRGCGEDPERAFRNWARWSRLRRLALPSRTCRRAPSPKPSDHASSSNSYSRTSPRRGFTSRRLLSAVSGRAFSPRRG